MAVLVALVLVLLGAPRPAWAGSESLDCQLCHQFPGLSRLDHETGELRLFFTSARHYSGKEGPHARLNCTDCHLRDEIDTVPHDEVSPVDCTQACHLLGASGVLTRFSHAPVADRLATSVHDAETLGGLPFESPPLRPGQSACLYCHDQPVYRDVERYDKGYRGHDPDARCLTCHDDGLPVDVDYYLRHTAGRLQPARPISETARACALCHSDEGLMEEADLHDAVTSYFRSFHGKAHQLGDRGTASCPDCHSGDRGDVHVMLAADDPESRTHDDNLASTCRSVDCHPNAVPELSAASVHLRVDPSRIGPEYIVIVAFTLLIVGVMSLYYLLFILEMVAVAFRRRDPEHMQLVELARAVAAHPEGRKKLERMSIHLRLQHWALVGTFLLLVATGMPMKFSAMPAMQTLAALFGGLGAARLLHRVSGIAICVVFGYHLVYLGVQWVRGVRAKRQASPDMGLLKAIGLVAWELPTMMYPRDILQFGQLFLHLMGLRKHRPELPRYHFSQKFEYWAVFWGMAIIGTSGIMLWSGGWIPGLLGGRALNFAYIVHSDEAFLAFMYIIYAHIFAVILSPTVLPLHRGTIDGQAPPEENAEGHAGYVREVARELGIEVEVPPMPSGPLEMLRQIARRTYALVIVTGILVLAFVTLRSLFSEILGGHASVEVEHADLVLRADSLEAEHGGHGDDTRRPGAARSERFRRGPLAHFHVIPAWFTPDPANSCTESGCHVALPHGEQRENRAFLNMHSTFIDCQVCHLEAEPGPGAVRWVSPEDRAETEPPAILTLAKVLEGPDPETKGELEDRDEILRALLEEALVQGGEDHELEEWLFELETSRRSGAQYQAVVAEMKREVRNHGRGGYGAKLGVPDLALEPNTEQRAAGQRLREEQGLGAATTEELVEVVHRGVRRPEVVCTRCHSSESQLVDFVQLGYPAARAEDLLHNQVERYSDAVEKGAEFYLPTVLDPNRGPIGEPDEAPEDAPVEDGGETP